MLWRRGSNKGSFTNYADNFYRLFWASTFLRWNLYPISFEKKSKILDHLGPSPLVNVVSERPLKKVLASQRDWALCGELTMALGINHLVYYQIKIVFPVDWLPPVHDALENKGMPFLKRSVCLLQIMRIRKKFILLHKVFKTNKWRVVNLDHIITAWHSNVWWIFESDLWFFHWYFVK